MVFIPGHFSRWNAGRRWTVWCCWVLSHQTKRSSGRCYFHSWRHHTCGVVWPLRNWLFGFEFTLLPVLRYSSNTFCIRKLWAIYFIFCRKHDAAIWLFLNPDEEEIIHVGILLNPVKLFMPRRKQVRWWLMLSIRKALSSRQSGKRTHRSRLVKRYLS